MERGVESERKKARIKREGISTKVVDMDEERDKDTRTKLVLVRNEIDILEVRNWEDGDLDGCIRNMVGSGCVYRTRVFENAVEVSVCSENVIKG